MSTETITPTAVERDDTDKKRPAAALFQYTAWVHVGVGAEDCEAVNEDAGTCDCSNPLHFHAWCRLPNQLQHREIREAALAAKARRVRQLRDPDTDAYVVLEEAMDALLATAEESEGGKKVLIEELVGREWFKDYLEAQAEVLDEVDDGDMPEDADEDWEPPKKWEHIERDRERLLAIVHTADDEDDELVELRKRVAAYDERIQEKVKELTGPRREALEEKSPGELVNLVRTQRVEQEGNQVFLHQYSIAEWLECTLTKPHGDRRFRDEGHMRALAPEVLDAIKLTFEDLETSAQRGAEGNS